MDRPLSAYIVKRICEGELSYLDAFTIEIAGLVTRVQPMFGSTREYCHSYLSELQPEFFIEVTPEGLVREQVLWEREALEEGLKIRKFSNPFLEHAFRSSIEHNDEEPCQ